MDLKSMLSDFLQIRGLELSEEKIKIKNIEEGFNFLGWNFRKYNSHLKVQPSTESIRSIKAKIGKTIRKMPACTHEAVIGNLNPIIREWGNYHDGVSSWRSYRKVNRYIFYALWQWVKRRHPMKSAKWLKDRYWVQIDSSDWTFSTGNCTTTAALLSELRLPEPYDRKLSRTVLRGEGIREGFLLPD